MLLMLKSGDKLGNVDKYSCYKTYLHYSQVTLILGKCLFHNVEKTFKKKGYVGKTKS